MKKIITILFSILSFIILFAGISIWAMTSPTEFLYDGTTTISIASDKDILKGTPKECLENISKECGVTVSKIIWVNNQTVEVFTTDPSLNGRVKLSKGELPAVNTGGFIANKNLSDSLQTGIFKLFASDMKVLIYPFDALESRGGYLGLCQFNSQDDETISAILSYLNTHIGPSEIYDTYHMNILEDAADWLSSSMLWNGLLALTCLLFIFTLVRYAISESRSIAILELNGYSKWRAFYYLATQLFPCFAVSILICMAGLWIRLWMLDGLFLFPRFGVFSIVVNVMFFIISLTVLFLTTWIQTLRYSSVRILNGKKPFAFLTILQVLLKYAILIIMLAGICQAQATKEQLVLQQSADNVWKQAENTYSVLTRFVTNETAAKRELEHKAAKVYSELENDVSLMLMDASNYVGMSDGKLSWESHAESGKSIYSIYGACIKVNKNYLQMYPVQTTKGENVLELLENNDTTWNVLVPVSMSANEPEIIENLKEEFYFQKVTVQNKIYADLKEENSPYTIDDLSINIIYVPDGTKYFTYNSTILPQEQNCITNPLVVVDGNNIDDSYYFSYLTHCCFFVSENLDPVSDLTATVTKYDALNMYNSVSAIYNERANEIHELEQDFHLTVLVEILLSFGLVFSIYLFCACWYVQHQFEITIKRMHGYSIWRICSTTLIVNFALTTIVVLFFMPDISWKLVLLLPLFDLLLTTLFCVVVVNHSFQNTIKGER